MCIPPPVENTQPRRYKRPGPKQQIIPGFKYCISLLGYLLIYATALRNFHDLVMKQGSDLTDLAGFPSSHSQAAT